MTRLERQRVLLVEDNDLDARTVAKALTSDSTCEVERVADLASGLDALQESSFDCVLLDLSLPDSEGLVSVETMVARSPHCPVVVLTGLDDPQVAIESVRRGAQDYLVKDTITPELVLRSIRYAVARQSVEVELRTAQDRLNTLHAREQIARDLHDTVIQRLFATGMSLQAVISVGTNEAIADRAVLVIEEIDDAIRELRAAIFGLHSLEVSESFAVEIAELTETYRETLGFEPVMRLGDVSTVPESLRHDVLAVVREALANVARHARATAVTVTVMTDHASLLLRVTDNGIGLAAADEEQPGRADGGNGLANLRARAETHRGRMQIDHGLNGGTELLWSVPLG